MNRSWLIVANWKMYFSYRQAINWCTEYKNELHSLVNAYVKVALLPSYDALSGIHELIKDSPIKLGAQSCAAFPEGAYTGQVQAKSLQELECTYCLVGHSEQRTFLNDNGLYKEKTEQLLAQEIIPIICIGESAQEKVDGKAFLVLTQQMDQILPAYKSIHKIPLIIAYEPLWAIGTGKTPQPLEIQEILIALTDYIAAHYPQHKPMWLYGGSVSAENITSLQQADHLQGFLIGKASTDFQALKKTISLLVNTR